MPLQIPPCSDFRFSLSGHTLQQSKISGGTLEGGRYLGPREALKAQAPEAQPGLGALFVPLLEVAAVESYPEYGWPEATGDSTLPY